MHPPRSFSLVLAAASIVACLSTPLPLGAAPAADSPISPARPRSNVAPPPVAGPRLVVSIREAVSLALARNFDIAIAAFTPALAEDDVIRERAAFDLSAVAGASANRSSLEGINTNTASVRQRKADAVSISGGVRQRLVSGAEYSLMFETARESLSSLPGSLDPNFEAGLTFTIRQPLLKNYGVDFNQARIKVAMATKDQTIYAYRSRVIETVDAVEQTYWELVFALENLAFRRKSLDLAKDLLRRNRIQVEVGTLAPIEITEAESTVASREEALFIAEREIRDREDDLKRLMNVTDTPGSWALKIQPTDKPAFQKVELNEIRLILATLRRHADIENARIEIDKKKIEVEVAKRNLLPEVDLNASASNNSFSTDSGRVLEKQFENDGYTVSGGISFHFPLGNRKAKAEYRQAQMRHAQIVASYHQKRQSIMEAVHRSVRRIELDVKRIAATRVARKLAEERLDAQEKKFKVGLSTSREILEDQEKLADALTKETRALIDYNKSLASLDRATHSTLERFGIEMSHPDGEKPAQK